MKKEKFDEKLQTQALTVLSFQFAIFGSIKKRCLQNLFNKDMNDAENCR